MTNLDKFVYIVCCYDFCKTRKQKYLAKLTAASGVKERKLLDYNYLIHMILVLKTYLDVQWEGTLMQILAIQRRVQCIEVLEEDEKLKFDIGKPDNGLDFITKLQ